MRAGHFLQSPLKTTVTDAFDPKLLQAPLSHIHALLVCGSGILKWGMVVVESLSVQMPCPITYVLRDWCVQRPNYPCSTGCRNRVQMCKNASTYSTRSTGCGNGVYCVKNASPHYTCSIGLEKYHWLSRSKHLMWV